MATFLLLLGLAYGGGFLTAWYLYRPSALATAQAKVKGATTAAVRPQPPPQSQPASASPAPKTGQDVPLSFYENLQKGNKSIIGSGLNPQRGPDTPAVKGAASTSAPQQAVKKPTEPSQPQAKPAGPPGVSQPGEGTFSVQVASTKDRKEADGLVARLVGKGYAAAVNESKVEGKGTWFRVRVGKRLNRADAEELAARLKSGAVVVQEK